MEESALPILTDGLDRMKQVLNVNKVIELYQICVIFSSPRFVTTDEEEYQMCVVFNYVVYLEHWLTTKCIH